jgi:hypothetical protein
MTDELRRNEFVEQMTLLERRLTERFELLERLIALGFDDARDHIRAARCEFGSPPATPRADVGTTYPAGRRRSLHPPAG